MPWDITTFCDMATGNSRVRVQREFRNDKAVFLWGFMLVWLAMLAIMTYVAARDGVPQTGRWTWPILALFWLTGIAAARWAATFARVRVTLVAAGVIVCERFPFSTIEKRYRSRDLTAPRVEETKDSDGDPYYTCVLELPGGHAVTVAEGSHRPDVEAVFDHLKVSLASVA